MASIDALLKAAVNQKASDLHVPVGMPPILRLFGELKTLPCQPLSAQQTSGLVMSTSALSNLIREGKISMINSMIQTGGALGMQTMDQALARYVKEGRITVEAALEKAIDKENFKKQLAPAAAPGAPGPPAR